MSKKQSKNDTPKVEKTMLESINALKSSIRRLIDMEFRPTDAQVAAAEIAYQRLRPIREIKVYTLEPHVRHLIEQIGNQPPDVIDVEAEEGSDEKEEQ